MSYQVEDGLISKIDWLKIQKPKKIILSANLFKSCGLLGALLSLEKNNLLTDVNTWVGTSLTAVPALLLSLKFSVSKVIKISHQISNLINQKLQNLGIEQMINIFQKSHLFDLSDVKKLLLKHIVKHVEFIPSLSAIFKQFNNNLILIGCQLTGQTVVFDKKNYPDMSCIDACLASISFPILFKGKTIGKFEFLDGSFANPMPISLFDDGKTPYLNIICLHQQVIKPDFFSRIFWYLEFFLWSKIHSEYKKSSSAINHLIINLGARDFKGDSSRLLNQYIILGYLFCDKLLKHHEVI
jgi:hypothetical protein